jgi:RimJ/RimL family protein N-acetyltransferase
MSGFPQSNMQNQINESKSNREDAGLLATLAKRSGDVVLRDGTTVRVRVMRPEDEPLLLSLFKSLSEESRWRRFLSLSRDSVLAAEAHREACVDYCHTFGLIALTGLEDRVVGHAFYTAIDEERAEVAFAIADDFQRRGLATILLGQLAEVAAANSIQVFEAETLASNTGMVNVFRESGFHTRVSVAAGELHVSFPTSLTPSAIEKFERRETIASINALKLFFDPRAVAVIGASRKRGSIGGEIFHNLLSYGFQGPVYPINPIAESHPMRASIRHSRGCSRARRSRGHRCTGRACLKGCRELRQERRESAGCYLGRIF